METTSVFNLGGELTDRVCVRAVLPGRLFSSVSSCHQGCGAHVHSVNSQKLGVTTAKARGAKVTSDISPTRNAYFSSELQF